MRVAAAALVLCLLAAAAIAVEPDEMLADPGLEARARALSKDIRCLVCQNQSIDDSDADLARDLRIIVRERIEAGDSDQGVKDFLVARYGDFVLLRPPVKPGTYLLWFGPLVILALGAVGTWLYLKGRRGRADPARAPLSAAELARVDKLMEAPPDGPQGTS